jgi:hypothetical protein
MKLMQVMGVMATSTLLTACMTIYQSPPKSSHTADIFMTGSRYGNAGHVYHDVATCAGREWVFGGMAGYEKWITVQGDQPLSLSIGIGDGHRICTAIATFTPVSGQRYVAKAVLPDQDHCALAINQVDQNGTDLGPVPVNQRRFKPGFAESSSWCLPSF